MEELMQSAASYGQTTLTRKDLLITEAQIGRGSFGTVFRAKHAQWGTVAYKRLNTADGFIESSCLMSVIKEVQAHSQLHHPNITQMIAVVHEPNLELGIVLWYEPHGSAFTFVNKFRVDWPWKIKMLYHVTLGLNYLHTSKPAIIHGDIKIQNVLIGHDFVAKLADFGLSKWREYSLTRSYNSSIGTTTHIAPERLRNINARRNEKTDVYSYGVLVWELLTGKLPFPDNPEALIIEAVKSGVRPNREDIPADVPSSVLDIMEICWVDQPAARPNSSALKSKLEALQTTHAEKIEKCLCDLRMQDSRNRIAACSIGTDEQWPIQTESRGNSWNSPGINIPKGSNPTSPLAPKQVIDSSPFNSHFNFAAATSVVPESNNSRGHSAENNSMRISSSNDSSQASLPRRLPDDVFRRQTAPPVGQAVRLTPPAAPPTGTRGRHETGPGDTVRSLRDLQRTAAREITPPQPLPLPLPPPPPSPSQQPPPPSPQQRHQQLAVAAAAAAAAAAAIADRRNTIVATDRSLDRRFPEVTLHGNGKPTAENKDKKGKLRETTVAQSIGCPTDVRHNVHLGHDQDNYFVSYTTMELQQAVVVGISQPSPSAGLVPRQRQSNSNSDPALQF